MNKVDEFLEELVMGSLVLLAGEEKGFRNAGVTQG